MSGRKWYAANHESARIKAEMWADDTNVSSDHVRNLARAYLDLADRLAELEEKKAKQ